MVAAPNLNPETTALSLMLAVIASSDAPLVLVDGDLKVIAASASFCRDFQIEPRPCLEIGFLRWGKASGMFPS